MLLSSALPLPELLKILGGNQMRQLLGVALVSLLITGGAVAQTASSKATAAVNTAVGCTVSNASNPIGTLPMTCHDIFSGSPVVVTPDNFVPVMDATVKVSNSESLFVSTSMVTGLYTSTTTKTKTGSTSGSTSTATGTGGVYERAVLLDGSGHVFASAYPV